MTKQTTYWLDWKNKVIKPSSQGLQEILWKDIEKHPITVFCSSNDWPYIEIQEKEKEIITDEKARTYQIGLAVVKELRGADEKAREGLGTQALKKCWELCPNFIIEHPSHDKETFESIGGWVFPPRFENLQQGTFNNIWKIDIKSCHGKIMREYPLPFGKPEHLTDQKLIEERLKQGANGFIRFYCKGNLHIKNNQIPFLPDYHHHINSEIKGVLLLHTRLFHTFKKQYQIQGQFYYTDFWIFEERKGDVNNFLDYCSELEKQEPKKGKMLTNAFYGAVGKSKFGGYNYRVWTLTINHLAVLQTYYLYRQFKREQVLAIRSDCIYINGELPNKLNKELYHLEHYQQVSFQGESNIFIHDLAELKSFANNEERNNLIKKFTNLIK